MYQRVKLEMAVRVFRRTFQLAHIAVARTVPFSSTRTLAKCRKQLPGNSVRSVSTSPWLLSDYEAEESEIAETTEPETLYRAIDILIKGHEASVLESYMTFMTKAAELLGIDIAGKLTPKFIADRSTFLKSIHIQKKHRVQYEIRTHRRVLQLKYMTSSTANAYLEYVERNLPAGVAMHVHRWKLERLPEHVRERMEENLPHMSDEDWEQQSKFTQQMKEERRTNNSDYEEYHTTKRFLLGTVM